MINEACNIQQFIVILFDIELLYSQVPSFLSYTGTLAKHIQFIEDNVSTVRQSVACRDSLVANNASACNELIYMFSFVYIWKNESSRLFEEFIL